MVGEVSIVAVFAGSTVVVFCISKVSGAGAISCVFNKFGAMGCSTGVIVFTGLIVGMD